MPQQTLDAFRSRSAALVRFQVAVFFFFPPRVWRHSSRVHQNISLPSLLLLPLNHFEPFQLLLAEQPYRKKPGRVRERELWPAEWVSEWVRFYFKMGMSENKNEREKEKKKDKEKKERRRRRERDNTHQYVKNREKKEEADHRANFFIKVLLLFVFFFYSSSCFFLGGVSCVYIHFLLNIILYK